MTQGAKTTSKSPLSCLDTKRLADPKGNNNNTTCHSVAAPGQPENPQETTDNSNNATGNTQADAKETPNETINLPSEDTASSNSFSGSSAITNELIVQALAENIRQIVCNKAPLTLEEFLQAAKVHQAEGEVAPSEGEAVPPEADESSINSHKTEGSNVVGPMEELVIGGEVIAMNQGDSHEGNKNSNSPDDDDVLTNGSNVLSSDNGGEGHDINNGDKEQAYNNCDEYDDDDVGGDDGYSTNGSNTSW